MPARVDKKAAAVEIAAIRRKIDNFHLIIKTTPSEPSQIAAKQKILEGLKEEMDKRCDRLDKILNIDTKPHRSQEF